MSKQAPLADRIWAMVEEVRDDIRQKVVEEPWFGRPVTEKLGDIHASLDQAQAKEQSPDRLESRDQAPETEHDQAQERDYGIDR